MKPATKLETVAFSAKGQVVIPRRLREELEIEEGTKAVVYREVDHIVLKPITSAHINRLRGSLKGTGAMKVFLPNANVRGSSNPWRQGARQPAAEFGACPMVKITIDAEAILQARRY